MPKKNYLRKSLDLCEDYGIPKWYILTNFILHRSISRFDSPSKTLFASVQKIQRHISTSPYVEVEQLVAKYTQINLLTDGYLKQNKWANTHLSV